MFTQPVHPALFRPHDHRIDIPQGIIQIESDRAEHGGDYMSELHLIIGNKNYSSWSLRAWILLKRIGVDFRETVVQLDRPEFKDEVARYGPSGRVPVLLHGELAIWDSLAICEYVAEVSGHGWPAERASRAVARAVCAEMHSGFANLRTEWPLNARARNRHTPMTPGLEADIERIDEIWNDCRSRFGKSGGPWLFGDYTIADAMYAPVVLRFNTYGAPLSGTARWYVATALEDPAMQEWLLAARNETWTSPNYEVG
jgi:glutathione S-transferase